MKIGFQDGLEGCVREGDVLNMSTSSKAGTLIRFVFRHAYRKLSGLSDYSECPNHDALVVRYDNRLWAGDCTIGRYCRLTSLYDYQQALDRGDVYALRVLRVPGLADWQASKASDYWMTHVFGTPYDRWALPHLFAKATFGHWLPKACGREWAHWCTESVRDSLLAADSNPYEDKDDPTPFTTFKRMCEGHFKFMEIFNNGDSV